VQRKAAGGRGALGVRPQSSPKAPARAGSALPRRCAPIDPALAGLSGAIAYGQVSGEASRRSLVACDRVIDDRHRIVSPLGRHRHLRFLSGQCFMAVALAFGYASLYERNDRMVP
jgi:hypothetical protein